MSRVLVVDDEAAICWGIARLCEGMGLDVQSAPSAEQGLELARSWRPDVLVLDVRLPGADGLSAMSAFRDVIGLAPVIVITAFGDLATAVRAIEQGAFEYVLKPFDLQEIRSAIARALDRSQPAHEPQELGGVDGMLGRSLAMQAVFKRIALAAASDAAVMLSGETGVGKELAARAIHRHSARRIGPFVAVNIAALNATLAEAELFGHTAGAFTGAQNSRKGLLVEADGGTLFIDEVADIPQPIQVKLLRALDQGEVLPVGADRPVATKFRVVSATHQNLHRLVESGVFRHDLFYRLCTFDIPLPALRDRSDDIPLLANYFAAQLGRQQATLTDETIEVLKSRPWYGNVRELRKAVEHALVLARSGMVLPSHLPPPLPNFEPRHKDGPASEQSLDGAISHLASDMLNDPAAAGSVYEKFLEEVEPPLLAAAMFQSNNQCAPAARALGMHRTTLKRKLEQYGIASRGDEDVR